ncbi:MAG: isoprenylcysteine carboxylmethyltransferase family protein [Candidatus Aquilonibacter sp.]|jgi:protein-S-isoprenylcysteine O-methyltransferase Ste14
MDDLNNDDLQALVFKNRGLLLTLPAALLAAFGRPDATGVALGLPLAIAGELVRCWAVGYSGVTTRGDAVEAPQLVTAGPYAYVRNPLYVGNFMTALGFAVAFTGKNRIGAKLALIGGSLATMVAVYATIVPHEEKFLRSEFGEAFERYCERVPPVIPLAQPAQGGEGTWNPSVIRDAESRTFVSFGVMLGLLVLKTLRT